MPRSCRGRSRTRETNSHELDVETDGAADQFVHVLQGIAAFSVATEGCREAAYRQYHGQLPATHAALGRLYGISNEPFINDHQTVAVGFYELFQGGLCLTGSAHQGFDACQSVAGGGFCVSQYQYLMRRHCPAPFPASRGGPSKTCRGPAV